MDTRSLYRLTGIPWLELMDEDDTHLLEVSVVNDETLRMKFHTKLISPSTKIHEVAALNHFVNVTNGLSTLVRYGGPPYALFN